MTHIATCGHAITGEGIMLTLAGYARDNTRCLIHVTYCWRCARQAYEDGEVLTTDEAVKEWLQGV